jgi:hypothetical protein
MKRKHIFRSVIKLTSVVFARKNGKECVSNFFTLSCLHTVRRGKYAGIAKKIHCPECLWLEQKTFHEEKNENNLR